MYIGLDGLGERTLVIEFEDRLSMCLRVADPIRREP